MADNELWVELRYRINRKAIYFLVAIETCLTVFEVVAVAAYINNEFDSDRGDFSGPYFVGVFI